MPPIPKVFISATSGDLRTARQVVKNALLTIGCHPVEQTHFGPDWRSIAAQLEGQLDECQALIHIAGLRYGAEPDPAKLPPDASRRSYTQIEYHLARQLQNSRGGRNFRVYTFIAAESFPYDQEEELESAEKRALQRDHRKALQADEHRYDHVASLRQLKEQALALKEPLLSLQQVHEDICQSVKQAAQGLGRTRVWMFAMAALILLVLSGLGTWQWQVKRDARIIRNSEVEERVLIEQIIKETREIRTTRHDLTAVQVYQDALRSVADKNSMASNRLKATIDTWTNRVISNPKADAYDLSIARHHAAFSGSGKRVSNAYPDQKTVREEIVVWPAPTTTTTLPSLTPRASLLPNTHSIPNSPLPSAAIPAVAMYQMEVDPDAEAAARALVRDQEKAGFTFRAEAWGGRLPMATGKAVRVQLFKGNEYCICVAVPRTSGVFITGAVLDFEGHPVGEIQPVSDGWGFLLFFTPKKTGVYVVSMRQTTEGMPIDTYCAILTGYK